MFPKPQKRAFCFFSEGHHYANKLCGVETIQFKMVLLKKHTCIIHLTCLTQESILS